MGCGVVPGNVYTLSGCYCGPYSSSINNRSSIGMIGCFDLLGIIPTHGEFWCPYMVINVNVRYNGGLLPEIILDPM